MRRLLGSILVGMRAGGVSFMPANANKSLLADARLSLSQPQCAEQYLNSPKVGGGVYLSSIYTIYARLLYTIYIGLLSEIKEWKKIR